MGRDVLGEACGVTDAFIRNRTPDTAAALGRAMDANRRMPIYLGEVVHLLRKHNAGGDFQRLVPELCAFDQLMDIARPAADATRTAVADAPSGDVMKAAVSNNEVYGERFVVEVYRAGKLTKTLVNDKVKYPNDRQGLGRKLGAAERDGLIPAVAITALHAPMHMPQSGELRDGLTEEAARVQDDTIQRKQATLTAAEAELRRLDQELMQQLVELGPAITPDAKTDGRQLQAYIDAFKASNHYVSAQEQVRFARQALGMELANREADIAQHMSGVTGDKVARLEARGTLLDSYTAIASSDEPWRALAWTAAHRADPQYQDVLARLDTIDELACVTAAAASTARIQEILNTTKENPQVGLEQVHDFLKQLATQYGNFKKLEALASLPGLVTKFNTALAVVNAPNPAAALDIVRGVIAMGRGAPTLVSRLTNALGGMFTTLVNLDGISDPMAAAQAGKRLYDYTSELAKILRPGLEASPSDLQLAKNYIKSIRGEFLTLGNVFAVLGIVQDGVALWKDIDKLGTDGSVEMWVKTIADGASLVGGIISLFPPPVGLIGVGISTIASVVSMVADLFIETDEEKATKARRENERVNLEKSGLLGTGEIGKAAAGRLTTDEGIESLHALPEYGITSSEIRELVSKQPFLFESVWNVHNIHTLWLGLTGQVSIPRRVPPPNGGDMIWEIKPGVATTFWQFLCLYDVTKLVAIYNSTNGTVAASLHLGETYRSAFPANAMHQRRLT